MDDTDDPEAHGKVLALVHEPEDDGKDDTAQVAAAASKTGQKAVGRGVDVRHKRKVGAVSGLVEDGHENDETYECADRAAVGLARVDLADEDEKGTSQYTASSDPALLEPEVTSKVVVEDVGNDTAQGPVDKVEEAKDCCIVAGLSLVHVGEVLLQVRAQDSVDGKLTAKGTGIGSNMEQGLRRVDNRQCVFEARLDHNFTLGNLHGLVARE